MIIAKIAFGIFIKPDKDFRSFQTHVALQIQKIEPIRSLITKDHLDLMRGSGSQFVFQAERIRIRFARMNQFFLCQKCIHTACDHDSLL